MSKSFIFKVIGCIAIISAGVAIGLAIFSKYDKFNKELDAEDEFEDEDLNNVYEHLNAPAAKQKHYVSVNLADVNLTE